MTEIVVNLKESAMEFLPRHRVICRSVGAGAQLLHRAFRKLFCMAFDYPYDLVRKHCRHLPRHVASHDAKSIISYYDINSNGAGNDSYGGGPLVISCCKPGTTERLRPGLAYRPPSNGGGGGRRPRD